MLFHINPLNIFLSFYTKTNHRVYYFYYTKDVP